MPRHKLPARLYLRRRHGREPRWVIVDGHQEIDTGCGPGDNPGATAKLGHYLATHRAIDTRQRDPAQISVADVIALYLKHFTAPPGCYHATPLLGFFGLKTLAEINGQLCRDYASDRGTAVTQSTVRRELVTLQAAINHWHAESPLESVPKIVKPPESPPRLRHLSRAEAAAMLRAARVLKLPHIARFILIGLYTGTRHEAILSLRWQPSADAGWIDVARAVLHRRGTSERQSNKKRKPARIPDRLMLHVRQWHARDMAAGPQAAIIRWQGRPLAKERRAFARVVAAAGLGSDVTPHTLKHTCATWALSSGMNIWDLAGLIGTSVKTIEATYGHHAPEFQIAVAGAFRRTA